jgi:hypothetical protein
MPEKVSLNHELMIGSFLVSKFCRYGGFLLLNAPSVRVVSLDFLAIIHPLSSYARLLVILRVN